MESSEVTQKVQMIKLAIQSPPWEVEYTRPIYTGQEFLVRHQEHPNARIWLYFHKDESVVVQPGWEFPNQGINKTYAYGITDDGKLSDIALRTYEGLWLNTKLPPYLREMIPLFGEVPSMIDRNPNRPSQSGYSIWCDGKHFALRSVY